MKGKRFAEIRIIAVLREHEAGMKTADLALRLGGINEKILLDVGNCDSQL